MIKYINITIELIGTLSLKPSDLFEEGHKHNWGRCVEDSVESDKPRLIQRLQDRYGCWNKCFLPSVHEDSFHLISSINI